MLGSKLGFRLLECYNSDHRYYSYLLSEANVFFDPSSTYSYVSVTFNYDSEILCDVIYAPIYVSTSVGESFIDTNVYRACPIWFIRLGMI